MAVGFKLIQSDGRVSDIDDLLVRRDLFNDGSLLTWGGNEYGQLGDNTNTNRSSPGITAGGGINWKQVSSSSSSTAAIKTDGTLWTWGKNDYGEIGDNTSGLGNIRLSPVQTIAGGTNWKQVSGFYFSFAAIKTNGELWTWGRNHYGQLGDNTTTSKLSPVQTIAGGTNWKQVACGAYHTAAIKTNGELWTWGYNDEGQLGNNTFDNKSSPIETIAGGTDWKQVACGYGHTAAIKTNGELWNWGRNTVGTLGDTTTTRKLSPVQTIAGGTNWKQVACNMFSTAAIKTNGELWTWGHNDNGQLGDNTTSNRSSPVQTIAGGTNWKQVGGGPDFSFAAIKTNGELWTWGLNMFGQLGDNTTANRSSPVQTIAGGTNWKQVSGNLYTKSAIKDLSI